MANWVNLHSHSEYSLLDGAGSVFQRAEQAKKLGQSAVAITDHGNLIGAPEHIKACEQFGLKPIVGVEAYFTPDRHLKDPEHRQSWHLLLLAKNEQGWKNLIKMTTEAHVNGFYHYPRLDWELLERYHEGLICSSACVGGYLPWLILTRSESEIADCIEKNLYIFGDNYYFELMPHDFPAQRTVNNKLVNLSVKYGVPFIATGDSHYPYENWRDTHDVLLMLSTGQTRTTRKKKRELGEDVYEIDAQLHMFSEQEMYEMFEKHHPDLTYDSVREAIEEAGNIADSIEPFEIDKSNKFPKFRGKDNPDEILERWCTDGMRRINKTHDEVYQQRLEHELKTIKKLGVSDYFVVVGKLVRWCRDEAKIRVSSGRGSAAGSLVCYLSRITMIDPIAHELLFERFLNPNRKGLPDIDIDFEHTRREEVKDWLANEYGEDHIANISAFQRFGAKSAIKDVSRVLDVPFYESNKVTKYIPEAKDVGGAGNIPPLERLRKTSTEIDEYFNKYPEVWKHALRVEGHIRGLSQHAAGIVLTDKPITEYMPLIKGKSGILTAWSDSAGFPIISDYGFPKIDILGLDDLTKQGYTLKLLKDKFGIDIDLDDLEISRNPEAVDQKAMEFFREGKTLGIFQFGGSKNITSFLRHMKPDRFEDLVAANALYRPGPLEGGDAFRYGDLKRGKLPITYWHESVKPYLEKTYGILCFQEQLQQIAQELGGFSPAESDDMRKATSKIYRMGREEAQEFMAQYYDKWTEGCEKKGLSRPESDSIWERMIAFGSYSFNRAHAASYALIAYQDAYLKTYLMEFYASLLTFDSNIEEIIREARGLGVKILHPDINKSEPEFTVTDEGLRYGLLSVKYFGKNSEQEIISKRPFTSIEDFKDRVEKRSCNKRVYEYLVWAGAFDSLGARDELPVEEKRKLEITSMGVALSEQEFSSKYKSLLKERINTEEEVGLMDEGAKAIIGGELTAVKRHRIKTGKNQGKHMGFVTISFNGDSWDCTLFKEKYEKYEALLKEGNVILLKGRKGENGEILTDSLIEIEKLIEAIEN